MKYAMVSRSMAKISGRVLAHFKKMTAVVTVICFVVTGVCGQAFAALTAADPVADRYRQSADDIFMIAPQLGRITDGRFYGGGQVVLNIQNLHCHPEVQKNIDKILGAVEGKFTVSRLCLEGAAGPLNTEWLSSLKDGKLRKTLLDAMVENGSLTGAEYHLLTAKAGYPACGLEDGQLYRENSLRLGRITAHKQETHDRLALLKKELDRVKYDYFNARQKTLDSMIEKHRMGRLETRKYYRALEKYTASLGIDFGGYAHLSSYLKMQDGERQIHYQRVTRQLQTLVTALKSRLPYSVYAALQDGTNNFSDSGELFRRLAALVRDYHIDLAESCPDLGRFLDYYAESTDINPVALVQEETCLEWELQRALAENRSQKDVVFLLDYLRLAEDYFDNKISSGDYAYFAKNYDRFKMLCECYTGKDLVSPLDEQHELLSAFYQANLRRNEVFVNNILNGGRGEGALPETALRSKLDHINAALAALKNGGELTVVVTGGFHTSGLSRLLDEKKISYLTITPNITGDTASTEPVYWEQIREQNIFYSQAFERALSAAADTPEMRRIGDIVHALVTVTDPLTLKKENFNEFEKHIGKILKEASYENVEVDINDINVEITAAGAKERTKDGSLYFTISYKNDKFLFRYNPKAAVKFEAIPGQGTAEEGLNVAEHSWFKSFVSELPSKSKYLGFVLGIAATAVAVALDTFFPPASVVVPAGLGTASAGFGVAGNHGYLLLLSTAIVMWLNLAMKYDPMAGKHENFHGVKKVIDAGDDNLYDSFKDELEKDKGKIKGITAYIINEAWSIDRNESNVGEIAKMKNLLEFIKEHEMKLIIYAQYPDTVHQQKQTGKLSAMLLNRYSEAFKAILPQGASVYMEKGIKTTADAERFLKERNLQPGDVLVINNGVTQMAEVLTNARARVIKAKKSQEKEKALADLREQLTEFQRVVDAMDPGEKVPLNNWALINRKDENEGRQGRFITNKILSLYRDAQRLVGNSPDRNNVSVDNTPMNMNLDMGEDAYAKTLEYMKNRADGSVFHLVHHGLNWDGSPASMTEIEKMQTIIETAHEKKMKLVIFGYFAHELDDNKAKLDKLTDQYTEAINKIVPDAKVHVRQDYLTTRDTVYYVKNTMNSGDVLLVDNGIRHGVDVILQAKGNLKNAPDGDRPFHANVLKDSLKTYTKEYKNEMDGPGYPFSGVVIGESKPESTFFSNALRDLWKKAEALIETVPLISRNGRAVSKQRVRSAFKGGNSNRNDYGLTDYDKIARALEKERNLTGRIFYIVPPYWPVADGSFGEIEKMGEMLFLARQRKAKLIISASFALDEKGGRIPPNEELQKMIILKINEAMTKAEEKAKVKTKAGATIHFIPEYDTVRDAAGFLEKETKPGDIVFINNGIVEVRKQMQEAIQVFPQAENKIEAMKALKALLERYSDVTVKGYQDKYDGWIIHEYDAAVPELELPSLQDQVDEINRLKKEYGVEIETFEKMKDKAKKGELKIAVTTVKVTDKVKNTGARLLKKLVTTSPSAPYTGTEINLQELKKKLSLRNYQTITFIINKNGHADDAALVAAVNQAIEESRLYMKIKHDIEQQRNMRMKFAELISKMPEDVDKAYKAMMDKRQKGDAQNIDEVRKVNKYLLSVLFPEVFAQSEFSRKVTVGEMIEGEEDKDNALSWIAQNEMKRMEMIQTKDSIIESAKQADLVILTEAADNTISTVLELLENGIDNRILLLKATPRSFKDIKREIVSYYKAHPKENEPDELIGYMDELQIHSVEEAVRAIVLKRKANISVVTAGGSLFEYLRSEEEKPAPVTIALTGDDADALEVVADVFKGSIPELPIETNLINNAPVSKLPVAKEKRAETAEQPEENGEATVDTAVALTEETGNNPAAEPEERLPDSEGERTEEAAVNPAASEDNIQDSDLTAIEERDDNQSLKPEENLPVSGILEVSEEEAKRVLEITGGLVNTEVERNIVEAIFQPDASRLKKLGLLGTTYFGVYYNGFDENKYAETFAKHMNGIIIMPGKVSEEQQLKRSIPVKFKGADYTVHIGVDKLFPRKVTTALLLHANIDATGFNGSEEDRREFYGTSVREIIETIANDQVLQRELLASRYGLSEKKIIPGVLHLNGLPTAMVVTEDSEALKDVPVLFTPSDEQEPDMTTDEQTELKEVIEKEADGIVVVGDSPDADKNAVETQKLKDEWPSQPVIAMKQGFTNVELEQVWKDVGAAARKRLKETEVVNLRPQVMIDVKAKEQSSTEVLTLTDIGNRVKQYYGALGTDLLLDVLDPSNPRAFNLEMLDESKVSDNLKNNRQQAFQQQLKELFQIARQPKGEGNRDIRVFTRYNIPAGKVVDVEEIQYLVNEVGFSGIWLDFSGSDKFPDAETFSRIKRAVPDAAIMAVPPAGSEQQRKEFRELLRKAGILPFEQITIDNDPENIEETDIGIQVVAGSSSALYFYQFLDKLDKFVTSDKAAVVIPSDFWSLFKNKDQVDDSSMRLRLGDEGQFLNSFARMIADRIERIETSPETKYRQAHELGLTVSLKPNKLDEFYKKLHLEQEHKEGEAYNLYDLLKIYNEADRNRLEEYAKSGVLFNRGVKLLKDSYPGTSLEQLMVYPGDLKKKRGLSTAKPEEKMMYDRMLVEFIGGLLEQVETKLSPDDATMVLPAVSDGVNFRKVKTLLGGFFTFKENKGKKTEKEYEALLVAITAKDAYEALRSLPGMLLYGKKYDEALAVLNDISEKINTEPVETKLMYLEALNLYAKAVGKDLERDKFKQLVEKAVKVLWMYKDKEPLITQGYFHNAAQIVQEFHHEKLATAAAKKQADAVFNKTNAAIARVKNADKKLYGLLSGDEKEQLDLSQDYEKAAQHIFRFLAMLNLSHNDKLFNIKEKEQIRDFVKKNLLTDYGLYSSRDNVRPAALIDYAFLEASIMKETEKTTTEISDRMMEIVRPLLTKAAENNGLPEYLNADGTLPDGQKKLVVGTLAAMVQLIAAYAERREESLLTEEKIKGAVDGAAVAVKGVLGIQEAA